MRTLIISVLLLITGSLAVSQTIVINNVQTLFDQFALERNREDALGINRYEKIDGSPFLFDEFFKGEVVINDTIRFENIPLRYNIFTDRIEFLDANNRVLEVNTANHRFSFSFKNRTFKIVQYNYLNRIQKGLLELLVEGNTRLYRKYIVEVKIGSPPMGYQAATRDRFIRKNNEFIIAAGDNVPILVTSRRKLVKQLQAENPAVSQYLKNNRVNLNSAQSMIDLVEFVNKPKH